MECNYESPVVIYVKILYAFLNYFVIKYLLAAIVTLTNIALDL